MTAPWSRELEEARGRIVSEARDLQENAGAFAAAFGIDSGAKAWRRIARSYDVLVKALAEAPPGVSDFLLVYMKGRLDLGEQLDHLRSIAAAARHYADMASPTGRKRAGRRPRSWLDEYIVVLLAEAHWRLTGTRPKGWITNKKYRSKFSKYVDATFADLGCAPPHADDIARILKHQPQLQALAERLKRLKQHPI